MDEQVGAILAGLDLWAEWPSETQRRIVGAALDSFAERGFHGTSLKHIAQGSGLSTAALYVHFGSKEELLFALSRRGHAMALEVVRSAATEPDPRQAAILLVRAFTEWHAEFRTVARIVQYELAALTPEHRADVADLRRGIERVVQELIERGVAAGVFSVPDPRGAATAVLSLGVDVARWYAPGLRWDPGELGVLYSDLVDRMLSGGN
ncbi:MAG: TetR/AcrR family transcriptional regulator [Pseudonocardiaceae bacterium]|nr:MAG: TetR/AcrR family transcriptional regulator [Pseudonocardiaceae bacterium]